MTPAGVTSYPNERLPWAATAAALTAFAALALIGGVTPALPLLGLGLLATYVVSARIGPGDWWVHWALRLALYSGVAVLNASKGNEGLADSLWPGPVMDTVGQMLAAELVIQAWRQPPTRPPFAVSLVLLSGLDILAASQTLDPRYPRLFVSIYLFFLLLALGPRIPGAAVGRTLAVLIALAAGVGSYGAVQYERLALTTWGARYLDGKPGPESTGLSQQPFLGSTFGLRGSPQRVLRITGLDGVTYLRGATFDTYQDGHWSPPVDDRPFQLAEFAMGTGTRVSVTPLAPLDGLLPLPLQCRGLDTGDTPDVEWSSPLGGPVRVATPQPPPYTFTESTDAAAPGPLAGAPSSQERAVCLALPDDLDPGVRRLAAQIVGRERRPQEEVGLVVHYLMAHHRYSLAYLPGPGDPVSRFLLQTPPAAAHCEYFAASAALLLRCVGIPTRYVVGYLAHETDSPGVTVVRQRDAHAWAEAWVSGIGWETVDATPPDGRPDQGLDTVPWWQRLEERLTDGAQALRFWLLRQDWTALGLGLGLLAICALAAQWLWRRRSPSSGAPGAGYTSADPALAALAAQFERLLARQGIPCPPWRPWQEHLRQAGGGDRTAALAFVRAYNAARFGPESDKAISNLTELLRDAAAEADQNAMRERTQEQA